jgi:alkylation response protein AidB-like acyl-CoA dehydrogenase
MKTTTEDTIIDTSKMSAGERAALEMAEAARDLTTTDAGSFACGVFMGHPDFDKISPFPAQSLEDRDQGDAFLHKLHNLLADKVDADRIDAEGEIPDDVIEALAEIGAFGIKIPVRYGGLGLSQTNYARAAMELGAVCGNLTALVSAHQSIGVPQPLILFGTEDQKKRFLPRVAKGEISAFALTESGVGSDPAKMKTNAMPDPEDSNYFILNGEKLWCTNGTKAGVIVVMARTPSIMVNGSERTQVTAFIVEMDRPGVDVMHRCRFMGLKALYNAVIRFDNVKVPRSNIILAEGKGLKVALTTLNTGRITLPAACTGLARECLKASSRWASEREQWGAAIGKHAAIADKLARMAADAFALEAMTFAVSGMVDAGKKAANPADIRIEAAMAKLWGTEAAWRIVDDTMQIRGGRGYETAASQAARGDRPVPVERWMRDCRINTIFEGSSEIMRLFIAREALDPHLKIGAAVFNTTLPVKARLKAMLKSAWFYGRWYPRQWLPLGKERKGIAKASRRLARAMFHAMLRFGPKLDKQQVLLGRFVDIGTELFAMSAADAYAAHLIKSGERKADDLLPLVDFFIHKGHRKINEHFRAVHNNSDAEGYEVAKTLISRHPIPKCQHHI